jgi:hypothetical protein
MSVSNVRPRDGAESAQHLDRARALLEEALQLIDAHAGAPELGARVQEVIEALRSRTD